MCGGVSVIDMAFEIARLRRLDERMIALQRQGRIGFHGSALGEEACIIGTAFALQPEDWVFPALRQGAIMLHRDFPLDLYLAQSFGCELDATHGRQMPCHQSGRSVNQVSWSSCIGNQIPQAVGAAFAARAQGDTRAIVGFMGDGATSEADFHYAMTFAGVWKVPVVLVCQNNQWAISEPVSSQTLVTEIYKKAEAYGFPGVRCNGQDVVEVHDTMKIALDRARAGKGPTFVELLTFRVGAHSTSDDPSVYRDEAAAKLWFVDNDPLTLALARARKVKKFDQKAFDARLAEFDRELMSTLERLEKLAPPALSTMLDDVYSDEPWHLAEQREELAR